MDAMSQDQPTVTVIHAVIPSLPPMRETLAAELAGVRVLHQLDEGLLAEVERRGGLTPECVERLATQVRLAVEAGADAVLLACTAYSPVAEEIQARFPGLPVLPVDQMMVEQAVARATRVGVLATVRAGLEQQQELIRRAAERAGKSVTVVPSLHPDAMEALRRGDGDEHDRILLAALPALAEQVELILLAQASMARLAPRLPANLPVPVLTSPVLAARRVRALLDERSTQPAAAAR